MDIIKIGKDVFHQEIDELKKIEKKLGSEFHSAVQLILNSNGKVVITGIGKSGIVGKKIAASLASTGTQAVFMNAAEAVHGDLGVVSQDDIVLAISNSGNSSEIAAIIPSIQKIGAIIIALTGNEKSFLGESADLILDIGVDSEACPLNIAPTSSSTATMVMGDALTVALMKVRDFQPEDFAIFHPGGSLGRRLLMRVEDVMHSGDDLPLVNISDSVDEVLINMTKKRMGAVCVTDGNVMVGIITEGDIRRALQNKEKFFSFEAREIMTSNFTSITKEKMALEALEIMENRNQEISVLPVLEHKKVIGIVRIHDLLHFVG